MFSETILIYFSGILVAGLICCFWNKKYDTPPMRFLVYSMLLLYGYAIGAIGWDAFFPVLLLCFSLIVCFVVYWLNR